MSDFEQRTRALLILGYSVMFQEDSDYSAECRIAKDGFYAWGKDASAAGALANAVEDWDAAHGHHAPMDAAVLGLAGSVDVAKLHAARQCPARREGETVCVAGFAYDGDTFGDEWRCAPAG